MTAKEFIQSKGFNDPGNFAIEKTTALGLMVEFAQHHVELALHSASNRASEFVGMPLDVSGTYPKERIK